MATLPATDATQRLRLEITGAVQGVGFRPHVYRLATELELTGWVVNDTRGVRIEVEGPRHSVERFSRRLQESPPPRALILERAERWLPPTGHRGFEIRTSDGAGEPSAVILPDLAPCPRCLADIEGVGDRRHDYPFTNCTDCGPRLSIVQALPYDRPNTTMAGFVQCAACQAEYGDPGDRRFHAQPNACPDCGPHLSLLDRRGHAVGSAGHEGDLDAGDDGRILDAVSRALGDGRIVALKGVGGFQLLVDAASDEAVRRLRERKARPHKPLAVMVRDVEQARLLCLVGADEARLLSSQEAPIVLLERRDPPAPGGPGGARGAPGSVYPVSDPVRVAPSVAPDTRELGLMLPSSPLHHLLMRRFGRPLVATSGNLSDEPICIDNDEALLRLNGVADLFVMHDRPIERHVDDAVVRHLRGEDRILRRARGYAPLPVVLEDELPPLLAVGGHLKNAVAVTRGRHVFVSQHIGDLGTPEARAAFARAVDDLVRLYRIEPQAIVHDSHPDYASTELARRWGALGTPRIEVQHHHAHLASVLAEHGRTFDAASVLGVTLDGTGYGTDGTIWGGEFLVGTAATSERVAHLRRFTLPGGEAAVREPRRTAFALLLEADALDRGVGLGLLDDIDATAQGVLLHAVERGLNAPETSSAGRLFDGVAALLGLGRTVSHEGQAAMMLENLCDPGESGAYPFELRPPTVEPLRGDAPHVLDWESMIHALLDDLERRVDPARIAARFHNGLAVGVARVAAWVGVGEVALTGGCILNRVLLERTADLLEAQGHRLLLNRNVPPGDGGICLGQAAAAAASLARQSSLSSGV